MSYANQPLAGFWESNRGKLRWMAIIVLVLIVVSCTNPLVIIGPGERGVVLNFGAVSDTVLDEGLNLRIPIYQKVVKIDVKIHKTQETATASSKDLQDATSVIAVNYHLEPTEVNYVYQHIGLAFKDRIIDPAIQEIVKSTTARYTAVELITQRENVRNEMKTSLKNRLVGYKIIVDDLAIVNFTFSKVFNEAIEAKQTADQLAQKASRDLERIKIEAEQIVTKARADAESLRLQREVVNDNLVQLKQIEANLKAIDKWDGHLPNVTSGVPFINLNPIKP